MHGEIVHTITSDFVRLHGFYRESKETLVTNSETGAISAAILTHGLGGNFYSSRLLFHLAQVLESIGIHVVIANTRGHDMINSSTWAGKTRSVGAAFEDVADSKMDISAWADFLAKVPDTRSNTSICLQIVDPWFRSLGKEDQVAVPKKIESILEENSAAFDINGYRDAPPGLRIWGGATVEVDDISALLPWLDWAYEEVKSSY